MLIALDYDGTYTADPALWLAFIITARSRGHEVWIVTMRDEFELDDVRRQLGNRVNRIVATGRKAKLVTLHAQGVVPDIWIDDRPDFLFRDAAPKTIGQPGGALDWEGD